MAEEFKTGSSVRGYHMYQRNWMESNFFVAAVAWVLYSRCPRPYFLAPKKKNSGLATQDYP